MASEDEETLAVIAVLILAGMSTTHASNTINWEQGWQWPIPDLEIRARGGTAMGAPLLPAVISQEFRGAGSAAPHYGVDLMYRNPNPPPVFTAWQGIPVAAARRGTLWSVQRTQRGWAVVIDHGKPWATFYQHLEEIAEPLKTGGQGVLKQRPLDVPMGMVLGTMGSDPTDGGHVRHLHFAAWYQGAGDAASVDPSREMVTWGRWRWTL